MSEAADLRIAQLTRPLLERLLAPIMRIAEDVPGEYWSADHFLAHRPAKFELSLIALRGGAPVGYAIVSANEPGRAHLHHLMVSRDARGTGLGSRLLGASMSSARLHGADRYTLKVARANEGARRFYERHGFTEAVGSGEYILLTRLLLVS